MEVVNGSNPFNDTLIMNNSKEDLVEYENKSDLMGLPGILATSIVLGLMTLTTIIGKNFQKFSLPQKFLKPSKVIEISNML